MSTKNSLINAFFTLLQTRNIENIRIRDITDLAGVTRGAFYIHYENIYSMLEEAEQLIITELVKINRDYVRSSVVREMLNKPNPHMVDSFRLIRRTALIHKALWGHYGSPHFQEKTHKLMREYLFGKIIFDSKANRDHDYIAAFIVGGFSSMLRYWLKDDLAMSEEEFALLNSKLMYRAFYDL